MAQSSPGDLLLAAQKYFDSGHPAIAEMALRLLPFKGPTAAEAANLRGRALLALNLPSHAATAFRAALEANPYFKPAQKNLKKTEDTLAAAKPPSAPRYLIIREWMEGFWSDVDHVLGACATAEAAGRIPIVHWGDQSRYRPTSGGDAWSKFFQPVGPALLADAAAPTNTFYPPKWTATNLTARITERGQGPHACSCALDILGRTETTVVSDFHCGVAEILPYMPADHPMAGKSILEARRIAISRYIRPLPEISARVEAFTTKNFGPGPMLAVHLRGTDKISEQKDLADINAQYPAAIARHLATEPAMRIFLLTDSEPFARWCRETYGPRVVTTEATRSEGSVGLHYIPGHADPAQLGVEVLLDTLLAARCDRLIGLASSNVSIFARDLKNWAPGACELFGIPFNDRPNVFVKLHAPPPRAV